MSDKLIQIAELVSKQTENGTIKWEGTPEPNTFQTAFPNYSILIQDSNGQVVLRLYNDEGRFIEELSDTQASNSGFTGMRELYAHVRRAAMGVDEALDDILKTLNRGASGA